MGTETDLPQTVARALIASYERFRDRIHTLLEPLSTEEVWRKPYPYGNTVGHLLLHLIGNLRYYIGAQMAGTGYVRNRPQEFSDPEARPKAEILQDLDDAVALVVKTLSAQSAADWCAPYQGAGAESIHDRFTMFMRSASHADHHLGQIIYLCKQIELDRTGHP